MDFIRNAKMGVRLGVGFGAVLLLAGITALGMAQLMALNDGTRTIVGGRYPKIELSQQAVNEINVSARALAPASESRLPEPAAA